MNDCALDTRPAHGGLYTVAAILIFLTASLVLASLWAGGRAPALSVSASASGGLVSPAIGGDALAPTLPNRDLRLSNDSQYLPVYLYGYGR